MSAVIRLATTEDAANIHQIYSPIVRDTHISFEQTVPTVREIAARSRKDAETISLAPLRGRRSAGRLCLRQPLSRTRGVPMDG